MAYKHSSSGVGGPGDMKSALSSLAGSLAYQGRVIMSTPSVAGVKGWNAGIKSFESLMSPYLLDDNDYKTRKAVIVKKLSRFVKGLPSKHIDEYYDMSNEWFALLCQKMTQFGAYPMTYVEEEEMGYHPEYIWENEEDE